jgi:hypothetical protein
MKGLSETQKREICYQAVLAEDLSLASKMPGDPDPFGRKAIEK